MLIHKFGPKANNNKLCILISLLFLLVLLGVYINRINHNEDYDIINSVLLSNSIKQINLMGDDIEVITDSVFNERYKIISCFNVGCGKCVYPLSIIDKSFEDIKNKYDVSFFHLGISNKTDSFMFKYIIGESRIQFNNPIYMYITSEINKNGITLLLLDKENHVIFSCDAGNIVRFERNVCRYLKACYPK